MKDFNRKGFTLVELLIVIVVIGVLSTMMMLSSTEAVSSAKAATIISDMRNLKTAALEFYADNMSALTKDGNDIKIDPSKIAGTTASGKDFLGAIVNKDPSLIKKYLGNDNFSLNENSDTNGNYCNKGGYAVRCANKGTIWYAIYRFADNENSLKAKVTSKAASTGLLGSDGKVGDVLTAEYNNNSYVCLRIF